MKRLTFTLIALSALTFWSLNASAQVPYTQNFEGATICNPAPGCAAPCNITASTGWTNVTDAGANYDWNPHQGPTGGATGPSVDHTLGTATGKFLFVESSGCNAMQAVSVESPVLNLTGASQVMFEYWLHHNGTGFATAGVQTEFQYSTNGSAGPFTTYAPATQSGNLGDVWNLVGIDLGPGGVNISGAPNRSFRIRHIRNNNGLADVAIDDINLYQQLQYDAKVSMIMTPPTSPPSVPAEYYSIPAGLGAVPIQAAFWNGGYGTLTGVFAEVTWTGTVDLGPFSIAMYDNGGLGYNLAPGQAGPPVVPNWSPSQSVDVTTYNQNFTMCITVYSPNEGDLNFANNQACKTFRRHKDTYQRDSGPSVNGWVFNIGFNGYWAVAYDFPNAGAFITGGASVIGCVLGGTVYPPRVGDPIRTDLLGYNAGTNTPGALLAQADPGFVSLPTEHEVFSPYPGGYQVTTPGVYVAAMNDVNNLGTTGGLANWIAEAGQIVTLNKKWYGYPITGPTWTINAPASNTMWRVRLRVVCGAADAGTDTAFCVGGSKVLGGNPTGQGPNGPFTYNWQPAAYVDDPTIANPTATPPVGTWVFTVQVTDATGCIVVDDATVIAYPYDVVQFVGLNSTYCESDPPSVLSANPPGGFSPVGTSPGTTWTWSQSLQTYSGPPVPIPDASPGTPGDLAFAVSGVYGVGGPGQDILNTHVFLDSVYVKINHTYVGDLDLILEAPNGGQVTLMNRPGNPPAAGCASDNVDMYVYRGTGNDNESACPPWGRYTAHGGDDLATVGNGSAANGTWHLLSTDYDAADVGFIMEFRLYFSPTAGNGTFDASAAGPGTHQIIYCFNNAFGCMSCDTQMTTVYALPDATITPTGPYCLNDATVMLQAATPGGTWSGPGIINMFTGDFAAGFAGVGTHTITYNVTDGNGCSNMATTTIVVRDIPTADAGADQTICDGSSVGIGGAPTGTPGVTAGGFIVSYLWAPNTGLSSSTDANPTASPSATTTYVVTVGDGNGCTDTDDVTVTVNANPTVDAGPNATTCAGTPVTIGGAPTASGGAAPYTYSWSPPAAAVPNPTVNPLLTTVYTVTVTDANGCTGTDQVTVVVSPAIVADAGVDASMCAGTTITIGGTPTAQGGTAPFTYSWTGGAAAIANPSVSPAATTTYTVTVTDANGCTDQDQVTVTVFPSVIADAGADQVICNGGSATIGGNPSAISGTPPYTYSWQPPVYLSSGTASNPTSTPPVSMSYTLSVTDANGCVSQDNVLVTIAANPTADAGQDREVCTNGTVTIGGSPTASGGTPPYTYMWSPPNQLSSVSVSNPDAGPVVTTTYTVVVTDANGCTDSDEVTVTSNAGPQAHAGVDVELCEGESAVIGGFPAATGGVPPYSFTWSPINDLTDYGAPNPSTSTLTTTVYILWVDDNNGCADADSVLVTVHTKPVVTISGLAADYCVDTTLIALIGTPAGGLWDGPGVFGTTFSPDKAGVGTHMIVYTYWDQWGCYNSDTAYTTVHALPVVFAGDNVTVHKGHSVVLNATVIGDPPFTYNWQPPAGLDNNTILNPTATPHVTTTYSLTVVDMWGCDNSDDVTVTVDPNTPINAPNTITPEPADGINDDWQIPIIDFFPENNLKIYNRWGQLVYETTNYSNTTAWGGTSTDGNNLPGGTYFYVFTLLAHNADATTNQLVHRGPITVIRHK